MSEIIKLRQRGQLTLPKKIRDQIGLKAGDYLEIEVFPETRSLSVRPARVVVDETPE